jgi:hypothetical protein
MHEDDHMELVRYRLKLYDDPTSVRPIWVKCEKTGMFVDREDYMAGEYDEAIEALDVEFGWNEWDKADREF